MAGRADQEEQSAPAQPETEAEAANGTGIEAEAGTEVESGPASGSDSGSEPVSPHAERRAETMRLFHRLRGLSEGDPERERLRAEIIEDHMAYARRIAARYGGHGEVVEDFVQVAYLGLVKAVDNFDPNHGTGFLGYATPMIMGEIKRYFRDATWDVHVPRRMQELSSALRKATEALTQELGHSPSVAELAERVHATPEEVVEAMDASSAYTTASLDRPVRVDSTEGASLADFVGGEDPRFDAVVNREVLKPLLAKLGERDKRILMMRFFRGMTQSQIGEELHVSQMQVSRLLTRILDELRAGFG
jgi:RNA polymerase sigma-B factor